jgi:hypothetical protein
MCSEILRAGCGAAAVAALVLAPSAVASSAGTGVVGPAVPAAVTDQFPLNAPSGWDAAGEPTPAGAAAVDQTPAIVPLPPALVTGLMGLGGMALFRVGRRVYRRR